MQITPQITLQDIPQSAAIESHIEKKIEKLDHLYDRIMTCRVILKLAQKSQHQGKMYNVHIDIIVPGEELVVNRIKNEDVYVAIRDSFAAAKRKLQDYSKRQRGQVKTHEMPRRGIIARIFKEEGYGFIISNGEEYYFSHANVSYPDFAKLEAGIEVQFLEAMGAEGLQANRVTAGKQ